MAQGLDRRADQSDPVLRRPERDYTLQPISTKSPGRNRFFPTKPTDLARTWVTPQPPPTPELATRARGRTLGLPDDTLKSRGGGQAPKNPADRMIDGVRCGRCRIRTYVGSRRQIYSLLPLAARAICLVRRLRCAEKLTTNPPRQCKLPAQHPCEQWCRTGAGTTVSVAGRPPAPEFVGPSWTGAQCG